MTLTGVTCNGKQSNVESGNLTAYVVGDTERRERCNIHQKLVQTEVHKTLR